MGGCASRRKSRDDRGVQKSTPWMPTRPTPGLQDTSDSPKSRYRQDDDEIVMEEPVYRKMMIDDPPPPQQSMTIWPLPRPGCFASKLRGTQGVYTDDDSDDPYIHPPPVPPKPRTKSRNITGYVGDPQSMTTRLRPRIKGISVPLYDEDLGSPEPIKDEKGTVLEKMLRIFREKVSMLKLKDVSEFNFSTSIFAAGIFDHKGGNLIIKDADVNLFIPEGAIFRGTRKEVYIYLDPDEHLNQEQPNETRVAPIIHCGPPGTTFEVPFVLSFPHCAENKDHWTFSGKIKDSRDADSDWEPIDDTEGISFVYEDHCIVMVKHFTGITMAGIAEIEGIKRMNICSFGKDYNGGNTYTFKVRAFNLYDKEAVIKYQSKNKETPRDDVQIIRVQNTGEDVKVNLKEIKDGWQSAYEPEMTLKHAKLWYETSGDGSDPPARCRFRLKNTDLNNHDSVYCRMKVKQNGNTDEEYLEMDTERIPDETQIIPPPADDVDFNLQMCRRIAGDAQHSFYTKLPEEVYHRLMTNLDVEREGKNGPLDWRALADAMGIKADTIEKMRINVKDPTLNLLMLLDTKYKTPYEFCNTLYEKLREAELLREAEWVSPYTSGVARS